MWDIQAQVCTDMCDHVSIHYSGIDTKMLYILGKKATKAGSVQVCFFVSLAQIQSLNLASRALRLLLYKAALSKLHQTDRCKNGLNLLDYDHDWSESLSILENDTGYVCSPKGSCVREAHAVLTCAYWDMACNMKHGHLAYAEKLVDW